MIHPSAIIEEGARLDPTVRVGAYALIEKDTTIGAGSIIENHAVIRAGAVLGSGVHVHPHTVIGGLPQDLHFNPEVPTGVQIGNDVVLREGVTISRATHPDSCTQIGSGCLLMANSHVAHDCVLGDRVILANGALLGGHVHIGNGTFVGGNAAIHQFCRIGRLCMIGGVGRVSQDIPPFTMMAERNELVGLNLIGMQRSGMNRDEIKALKQAFHHVFGGSSGPIALANAWLENKETSFQNVIEFYEAIANPSKKGVARPATKSK